MLLADIRIAGWLLAEPVAALLSDALFSCTTLTAVQYEREMHTIYHFTLLGVYFFSVCGTLVCAELLSILSSSWRAPIAFGCYDVLCCTEDTLY